MGYVATEYINNDGYMSRDEQGNLVFIKGREVSPPVDVALRFIFISDLHGKIEPDPDCENEQQIVHGGFEYLAGKIHDLTNEWLGWASDYPEILWIRCLVAAGDLLSAESNVVRYLGAEELIKLLNQLDITAACLGNRDFDLGIRKLKSLMPLYKMQHGFLLTNIRPEPICLPGMKTCMIRCNGTYIGAIGLLTREHRELGKLSNYDGISIESPVECSRTAIEEVSRAQLKIAVTHLPKDEFEELARHIHPLRFIINGHEHEVKEAEEISGTGIELCSAGSDCKEVGNLDIYFADGTMVGHDCHVTHITSSVEPQLEGEVDSLKRLMSERINEKLREQVAALVTDLIHNVEDDAVAETELGTLVADSIQWKLRQSGFDCDFAAVNSYNLRSSLYKGDITRREAEAVLPFPNTLVVVKLTGQQVKKLFRDIFDELTQYHQGGSQRPPRSFLQVSKTLKIELGSHDLHISVQGNDGHFRPISDEVGNYYTIGTTDFVASNRGGATWSVMKDVLDWKNTGLDQTESWVEYLSINSPIKSPGLGRIARHKED